MDDAQGGGEHPADVAVGVFRPEVGGSYDVAVADKSTRLGSTPIDPPARFVPMPARRAGLAGVGFGNQHHGDSVTSGFVGDVRAYPSVRPLADLLLAFRMQSLAVSDVSYIAERDHCDLLPDSFGHHRVADLVFKVSNLGGPSGSSLDFRSPQGLPSPRPFFAQRHRRL